MFCPHCGSEMAAELKYCKRCGGPNPLALAQMHETRPAVSTGTAWAAGATTALVAIIGIGVSVASLIDMVHAGLHPTALAWIALFCMLTVFGCVALLLRFWAHLLGASRAPAPTLTAARPADTSELNAQQPGALPDARFSGASVTEHTTRTLEHSKK